MGRWKQGLLLGVAGANEETTPGVVGTGALEGGADDKEDWGLGWVISEETAVEAGMGTSCCILALHMHPWNIGRGGRG